jgi:hypothetical protein
MHAFTNQAFVSRRVNFEPSIDRKATKRAPKRPLVFYNRAEVFHLLMDSLSNQGHWLQRTEPKRSECKIADDYPQKPKAD